MPDIQLKVKRTDRQKQAWSELADPAVRRLLFGGAKGGGKSYFLCVWLFTLVWSIMVKADLRPSKNPPHVAWFGRKQATDLTGTTLQTWREVIPEEYYELKGGTEKDPKHILIAGRIAIDYGGLDKQENINKFNSAEYMAFAIDQAEEVTKDEISVLRGSLRMVLKDTNGKPLNIPFKELYTANPRNCWLKSDFILNPATNARFVPALPSDNPYLPGDYIQTLEEAFGHRPELLAAYRDGDWSMIEGADQIIKMAWLAKLKAIDHKAPFVKRYIVCDTARFGDDECVIYYMENLEIAEKVILPQCRSTEISGRIATMSRAHDGCPAVVEAVGSDTGAAVIDELVGLGVETVMYQPQGKSTRPDKFYNVRSEAWDKAAKICASGVLDESRGILASCVGMYQKLMDQLCTPTYKWRNGKILIESKADIKKRLGGSPDHGDTFVIACWAWDKIPQSEWEDDYPTETNIASSYIVNSSFGGRR